MSVGVCLVCVCRIPAQNVHTWRFVQRDLLCMCVAVMEKAPPLTRLTQTMPPSVGKRQLTTALYPLCVSDKLPRWISVIAYVVIKMCVRGSDCTIHSQMAEVQKS